jgi:hypothetical protein
MESNALHCVRQAVICQSWLTFFAQPCVTRRRGSGFAQTCSQVLALLSLASADVCHAVQAMSSMGSRPGSATLPAGPDGHAEAFVPPDRNGWPGR